MTSRNDITRDKLRSKATTQAYRDNWDLIFGKKTEEKQIERRSSGSDNLQSQEKGQSL